MEENNYIQVETDDNTPDPAQVKPYKTGLLLGVIGFIALSLNEVLVNLIGGMAASILGLLNIVIFIMAMVIAVRRHRDIDLGGYISTGRAFGTAMLAAGVMILASNVQLYFNTSTEEYKQTIEQQFAIQEAEMEGKGMSDEDIENVMRWSKMFTSYKVLMVTYTVVGGILAMIIAFIIGRSMRREAY